MHKKSTYFRSQAGRPPRRQLAATAPFNQLRCHLNLGVIHVRTRSRQVTTGLNEGNRVCESYSSPRRVEHYRASKLI